MPSLCGAHLCSYLVTLQRTAVLSGDSCSRALAVANQSAPAPSSPRRRCHRLVPIRTAPRSHRESSKVLSFRSVVCLATYENGGFVGALEARRETRKGGRQDIISRME